MRISSKGRCALAALTHMARQGEDRGNITLLSLAGELGLSKVYLEQVFSLLKRGGLVASVKGAQGGYRLARPAGQIRALEVLEAAEGALFERTEETVGEKAPELEAVLQALTYDALDRAVTGALSALTLADLAGELEKRTSAGAPMYYI
ncbi:MAG: Rrf2 family transcriptional regulator [Christensenellales bacterium]